METPPTKQLKLTIEGESDKKLIMTFLCNVNEKIECDYDRKTQEVSWEPLRYIDTLKSEEEFESDGRLKSKSSDLHSRLDKFRHTEIQVQALLKKYKDIEVKDKKSLKESMRIIFLYSLIIYINNTIYFTNFITTIYNKLI